MTKLYIIRHAEAEGNLYRRVQGHYDSLVTDMGREQIAALWARFSDIHIDAVYSSDLNRAMTTARGLSMSRGLAVKTTPRLREVYMGHWEDVTWAQLEREEPEQLYYFSRDPSRWDIGSNEKFDEQKNRIVSAVLDIAALHPDETIAIVSHGNVIRSLLTHALDLPPERFEESAHSDNTGVSLLEVEGDEMRVVFMNDNSHLPPEISTFARQSWWRKGKRRDGNMDFVPMDLENETHIERYLAYRKEAWVTCYGDLDDFDQAAILAGARAQAKGNPRAVVEAILGEQSAGLLELAIERDTSPGAGAISCLYLAPAFRGRGLGVQLIGHAVSVYRPLGRDRLVYWLGEKERDVFGFFRRFGFIKAGETEEAGGVFWQLEKNIAIQKLD